MDSPIDKFFMSGEEYWYIAHANGYLAGDCGNCGRLAAGAAPVTVDFRPSL